MARLKREAARSGRTKSALTETALRLLLQSQRKGGLNVKTAKALGVEVPTNLLLTADDFIE